VAVVFTFLSSAAVLTELVSDVIDVIDRDGGGNSSRAASRNLLGFTQRLEIGA
jgi:hypothetical protein